ncbi:chondroitin proteoglycan-2-like isoform X2 [Colias croceus]|uniref:chondroitin proteoglycan-2-like isoform X2 n=1 Tax=Colias crocea TaxID=72248 RepID=UPI001E28161F|nr:chondroitin proteoglycan-2-like isoform X2 [Colias croceus]
MRVFVFLACICAVAYGQILTDDSLNANQDDEFSIEDIADAMENNDFSSAKLQEAGDVGAANQDNVAELQESADVGDASQDTANLRESSDIGEASQDTANLRESSDIGEASQDTANLRESSDIGEASQDTANLRESSDIGDASQASANLRESSDIGDASQDSANLRESSDVGIEDGSNSGDVAEGRQISDKGDVNGGAPADQYEEQSAPISLSSKTCIEKNERYSIPGSCDRYIECLNGTAEEKTCPDGLRYNPNVKFNVYPCQYPIDVPCLGRSALQPAQPTDECPHQFGYFKIGDRSNCGKFKNCVNGVAYEFNCPEGLAFSSDTYRCEWPDLVSDCDAEAFLGFRCPEVPISKELGPPAGFRFYRSQEDCQKYFICIDGRPRRLACGGYTAFDDLSESCVAADEVSSCPLELRNRAETSRKAETQRQSAQNKFAKLRLGDFTTVNPNYDDDRKEELQEQEYNYESEPKQEIENVTEQ